MPPRHAYWTILIDQKPTAFRARDRDELLPTLHQLKRTNDDVVMRYFARGKLWDSPEQAQWAARHAQKPRERRGKEWRPGGQHRDPRARFEQQQRERNQKRRAHRFEEKQQRAAARPKGKRPSTPARNRPPQSRNRAPERRHPQPSYPRRPRPADKPERRREPPQREPERPPRPVPDKSPEPPPPEQIVIKPEPPERG